MQQKLLTTNHFLVPLLLLAFAYMYVLQTVLF